MTAEIQPVRPARPATVELAAAVLIVGGALQLLLRVATLGSVEPGAEAFAAITLALDAASIGLGVLVRDGRAWLIALNFAAVLGFLDLQGAGVDPLLLGLGLAEVLVVAILLAQKPWFDAMVAWRVESSSPVRD